MFSKSRNSRKKTRFGRRPTLHADVVREKRKKTQARTNARRRKLRARRKQEEEAKKTLKPSELKQRHKLRRRRRFIIWIVLWVLLAGSFLFALAMVARDESVTIRTVVVNGAQEISEEDVRTTVTEYLESDRLRIIPPSNIAAAPIGSIERELLSAYPRIEEVSVEREGLTALSVTLVERTPAFVACPLEGSEGASDEEATCLLGDRSGVLFAEAPESRMDTYETFLVPNDNAFQIGASLFDSGDISGILNFIRDLEAYNIQISSIEVVNETDIRLDSDEEYDLLVEVSSDFERVLENLATVLDSELLRRELSEKQVYEIDLRFGDKVFYRFAEEQGET